MKKYFYGPLLLFLLVASFGLVKDVRAEFSKCSCFVYTHEIDGSCKEVVNWSEFKQTEWLIGQSFELEVSDPDGGGNISLKPPGFTKESDCKIISSFLKDEATKGNLCFPDKTRCELLQCDDPPSDICEIVPTTLMTWDIGSQSTKENPIKVDFGEKKEVKITATWATNIKFGFVKEAAGFEISSLNNIATVTFDTNKISNVGEMSIGIYATNSDNPSEQLSGDLWFLVGVNCHNLIAGLSCNTPEELAVCEKKCAHEYCEFNGSDCVEKTFGEPAAPATPATPATPDIGEYLKEKYPSPRKTLGWEGALPDCAFRGDCRNVNDLLELIINFGKGMFMILGSFAFAFFVYGGFTMIISMGNAEKQKKGQQILIAAVIGIIISFSAYTLIKFMLDAIGVGQAFRGIK